MIGLDTNVLARYFVAEAGADTATENQRQAARQLIESGQPLFLPKTVALDLEWVLRGYYGFAAPLVLAVFDLLLGHPTPHPQPDAAQPRRRPRRLRGPVTLESNRSRPSSGSPRAVDGWLDRRSWTVPQWWRGHLPR